MGVKLSDSGGLLTGFFLFCLSDCNDLKPTLKQVIIMPSAALLKLSEQIDKPDNNSFVRFFLYAALLNSICNPKESRSFRDTIPKIDSIFSKPMQTNTITSDFVEQLDNYKRNFDTQVIDPVSIIQRILMSFFRQGQISDLIFIINKLHANLNTDTEYFKKNSHVFSSNVTLIPKRQSLMKKVQEIANVLQNIIDNLVYATFFLLLMLLSPSMTIPCVGLMLTLIGTVGFGYAAYSKIQNLDSCVEILNQSIEQLQDIFNDIIDTRNKRLTEILNYDELLIKTVAFPLRHCSIKLRELFTCSKEHLDNRQQEHDELETDFKAAFGR